MKDENAGAPVIDAVGAVIIKNGKILLIKRASYKKSYPGCWCAIGGSVEEGETPQEAIIREVKEETNLDFSVKQPLGVFMVPEDGYTLRVHRFLGDISGDIKLNYESSEYGWFGYKECKNLKIGFHYEDMIELIYSLDI